ncbi:MAG TPA: alpha-galactosidase [Acidobacteriaceae bacterium]|nr:alpha-galactosidase [Acidobacteriaceae bacterium]
MRKLRSITRAAIGSAALRLLLAAVLFSVALQGGAASNPANSRTATLNSTDIHIVLIAGAQAPSLRSISGSPDNVWRNQEIESPPPMVYIDNASVPVTWTFKPDLSLADSHHVEFVYESAKPHLQLRWRWQVRAASGPIEHDIQIVNLSGQEIWLPLVDSLRLNFLVPVSAAIENLYIEKGADTPSAHGTHLDPVIDGYTWMGRSTTYAHPIHGQQREIIPAEIVYTTTPRGSSKPDRATGWYAGIEFSGRTRITLERQGGNLKSVLGLNPELGPFRTRLLPHESFESPTIFLGAFTGSTDDAGNQLRHWVRSTLTNPKTWQDPEYPLLVNDSWGSAMQVDEALALRMIANSKDLGLDMFQLDAGWFRSVGDWYPDPQKFPHGLAFIADAAHHNGLRFGLWVDWAQAGLGTSSTALNVRNPEVNGWLVNDLAPDWKPEEFKGQTIDLGVPAAHQYASREVKRIVEDYHLDMLEHDGYLVAESCTRADHPHAPPDGPLTITHDAGFDFALGANSTDVSYHAVRSYYSIYEKLRREHPGLLFEICNDGGRMVDFGSAAHGDYFSITDTYDPLSNRRAFFDASHLLPPAMLESYVEQVPTPNIHSFLYMLRSGMMGWTSIMLDTTAWSEQQRSIARHAFALYKTQLRPLIRDANLYHVSARPDGVHWDAMELWDPKQAAGVLFAFRGSILDEPRHSFRLAGLRDDAQYQIHCEDRSSPDRIVTGRELRLRGLSIHLQDPLSSELVFLRVAR